MSGAGTQIRRATRADLPALGRLGALLLRTHYGWDARRFMTPPARSDEGYAAFLGTQLDVDDVVVFVAERDGRIVGYVYAGLEEASWKELRDAAGFVHDLAVEEGARRSGVAVLLMEAAAEWLRARGAPRVMLWVAEQNEMGQQLFAKLGFRRTMVEMTRELE